MLLARLAVEAVPDLLSGNAASSLYWACHLIDNEHPRPPSFKFPDTVLAIMQKNTPNYPRFIQIFFKPVYLKSALLLVTLLIGACAQHQENRIDLKNLDTSAELVGEKTALMRAAEIGDSQLLKQALEQGGKINAYTEAETAFSLALNNGYEAISRILLSAGSDWQRGFDETQGSALIVAADQGFDEIVKTLIIKGATLETKNDKGYTALAKAAKNGHLTTLKILINAGAKVNVAPEGRSVLMHVVEKNNMLLSQIIIAAGADLNFTDADGDTALKIARRNGFFDLDLMLIQAGARP
jgi:ankyrin repeat protein